MSGKSPKLQLVSGAPWVPGPVMMVGRRWDDHAFYADRVHRLEKIEAVPAVCGSVMTLQLADQARSQQHCDAGWQRNHASVA